MDSNSKSKPRRQKYFLASILLLAVVIYFAFFHRSAAPDRNFAPAVAVAKAGRSDLSQTVSVTGEMRPNQQIDLHAKVAGYLQKINVDIGDHVKAGDVIAVLEIPELNEEVESARAATGAAQEGVKSAQAKYDEIHLSLQRLQEVAKKNPKLIAQQDLDNAISRDVSAAADLGLAKRHAEASQADQDKVETMAQYATITAPFDGVITRRYADPGALIQAGTSSSTQAMPVVSLAQDSVLRAVFPLPESIVAQMKVGDDVQVHLPDLDRTIRGKLVRFSRQVERATRTMEGQIDIPNPDLLITPGMYAVADFSVEAHNQVVTVPVQAVKPGGEPVIFVVNDKHEIETRHVTLGLQTPEEVEIERGLKPGELVVIGDTSELRDGMKVISKEVNLAETPVQKEQPHG